jgi:hypothetical protein
VPGESFGTSACRRMDAPRGRLGMAEFEPYGDFSQTWPPRRYKNHLPVAPDPGPQVNKPVNGSMSSIRI